MRRLLKGARYSNDRPKTCQRFVLSTNRANFWRLRYPSSGMPEPAKYFIACELNALHRVLDLPSQYAHLEGGLVQAITGNGSEYQKWVVELVSEQSELFTIR